MSKQNATIKNLENSQVEITGVIAWADLKTSYDKALESIRKETEIDGFRKGNAPAEAVEAKIGQMAILQEAAQYAISDWYPAVVMENKIHVIGHPQIAISKLAPENDLEFIVTTTVFPEIKLGDYKKIAKKVFADKPAVEVTDKDVDESIERILDMHAHTHAPEKEGEEPVVHKPELNEEFVKKMGDFAGVDEFKAKLREQLTEQKTNESQAKQREQAIVEIVEASTFEVPQLLIDVELDKIISHIKDDISRMGLEFDKYLEHIKKTEADLRTEHQDNALKNAQAELILKKIAADASLEAPADKVDEQVKAIAAAHKDAPLENIKAYVEAAFINQVVLEFLESQA